jgi:hypothetical protein
MRGAGTQPGGKAFPLRDTDIVRTQTKEPGIGLREYSVNGGGCRDRLNEVTPDGKRLS